MPPNHRTYRRPFRVISRLFLRKRRYSFASRSWFFIVFEYTYGAVCARRAKVRSWTTPQTRPRCLAYADFECDSQSEGRGSSMTGGIIYSILYNIIQYIIPILNVHYTGKTQFFRREICAPFVIFVPIFSPIFVPTSERPSETYARTSWRPSEICVWTFATFERRFAWRIGEVGGS